MARDDELGGRGGAKSTRAVVRQVGHGSSGGHSAATLAARTKAPNLNTPLHDHHHPQRPHMPYEYQEYPKWVHPDGKPSPKSVIVQNRGEEETVLGGDPVIREAEERKRLIAVAEVKDVRIDKRWGSDNLRAAIVGAGHDPELNPFA